MYYGGKEGYILIIGDPRKELGASVQNITSKIMFCASKKVGF